MDFQVSVASPPKLGFPVVFSHDLLRGPDRKVHNEAPILCAGVMILTLNPRNSSPWLGGDDDDDYEVRVSNVFIDRQLV